MLEQRGDKEGREKGKERRGEEMKGNEMKGKERKAKQSKGEEIEKKKGRENQSKEEHRPEVALVLLLVFRVIPRARSYPRLVVGARIRALKGIVYKQYKPTNLPENILDNSPRGRKERKNRRRG